MFKIVQLIFVSLVAMFFLGACSKSEDKSVVQKPPSEIERQRPAIQEEFVKVWRAADRHVKNGQDESKEKKEADEKICQLRKKLEDVEGWTGDLVEKYRVGVGATGGGSPDLNGAMLAYKIRVAPNVIFQSTNNMDIDLGGRFPMYTMTYLDKSPELFEKFSNMKLGPVKFSGWFIPTNSYLNLCLREDFMSSTKEFTYYFHIKDISPLEDGALAQNSNAVSQQTQPAPVVASPAEAPKAPVATAPATPVADSTPFAPSFDCAKASNNAEKMICGDRNLSKLDVQLSQTYSAARSKAADKDKLKSEQIAWVKTSRACPDASCLTKAFQDRIKQLSN